MTKNQKSLSISCQSSMEMTSDQAWFNHLSGESYHSQHSWYHLPKRMKEVIILSTKTRNIDFYLRTSVLLLLLKILNLNRLNEASQRAFYIGSGNTGPTLCGTIDSTILKMGRIQSHNIPRWGCQLSPNLWK